LSAAIYLASPPNYMTNTSNTRIPGQTTTLTRSGCRCRLLTRASGVCSIAVSAVSSAGRLHDSVVHKSRHDVEVQDLWLVMSRHSDGHSTLEDGLRRCCQRRNKTTSGTHLGDGSTTSRQTRHLFVVRVASRRLWSSSVVIVCGRRHDRVTRVTL